MPIRLLIADDHAVFRQGLAALLGQVEELELIGQADDGEQLLRAVRLDRPDIVLTDLEMPGPSPLTLLATLRQLAPTTPIIVLTMHKQPSQASQVIELGVDGYVVKEDAFQQVVDAVFAVASGKRYVSPGVAADIVAWHQQRGAAATQPGLSARELEVLRAIADGHTNRRIASELGISVKTVETHRASLMRKLKVRSAAALVRVAMERGYLGES
ncbi:MAG: response regulator transcription factor [Pirellulaceae bacterium]|nr:response regulator transcription factor [Pirellulaceae bacterium]